MWRDERAWSAVALALCGLARATTIELALEIVVDQRPTGIVSEFRLIDDALYAPRSTLEDLSLPAPGSDNWVRLSDVAGLSVRVDEAQQRIELDLAPERRAPTSLQFGATPLPAATRSRVGASLDYDVELDHYAGRSIGLAALTPHVFGPYGVFSDTHLWNTSEAARWRRLDTFWESDFPERAEKLVTGDAIAGGLDWVRPTRFAGIHWGSDYTQRPDLVTYPLPAFSGQANVPSALDLVVNGLRTATSEVPAGPFSIPQLPIVTGGGDAIVVLRDMQGREQTFAVPFFVSPDLLRANLNEFAFDAGVLRRGYGSDDDRYRTAMASFSDRYGLSDDVTLEGHLEGTSAGGAAGAGLVGRIAEIGAWHGAVARSSGEACDGNEVYLSTEWQRGPFSAHTLWLHADRDFCDLAVRAGAPLTRGLAQAGFAFSGSFGQIALTRTRRSTLGEPAEQLTSLSWSRRMAKHLWLTVSTFYDESVGSRHDFIGEVSVLVPLDGGRASLDVDAFGGSRHQASTRLDVAPPAGEGWGGYAEVSADPRVVRGGITDRTGLVEVRADVENTQGNTALRLGGQGAFAWLDSTVYATRRIGDAFAVVDAGAPDVAVYRENQVVGRSAADGRFLVDELRPFESNHLTIDPRDLPPASEARTTSLDLRPYRGGGLVESFGVRTADRVELTLVFTDGAPVPVGSVYIDDAGEAQTVGYGGRVYVHPPRGEGGEHVRGAFGECRLARVPRRDVAAGRRVCVR